MLASVELSFDILNASYWSNLSCNKFFIDLLKCGNKHLTLKVLSHP